MTELPGWRQLSSGKVRDLYVPEQDSDAHPSALLLVASDRISAFDHVLSPGIPGKGELLTTLSLWWFDRLSDIPNHLLADHRITDGGGIHDLIPQQVAGRAMLVRPLTMLPIECVVRGYLTGSGWVEYRETQTVCGIRLPAGLENGDRLPEPIFTPAWKAPMGQHDENITFDRTVQIVGADAAESIRNTSLEVYARASRIAETRDLIIADTKFEFGMDDRDVASAERPESEATIRLADEVLTSDSSRYWDARAWAESSDPAERMASFDKQALRDWVSANWVNSANDEAAETTPPELPPEVVASTASRYRTLVERLTGG